MKRARTVSGWLLLGLLGGAVAQGCGSSERPKHNPNSGANAGTGGTDGTSTTVQPPGNGGGGGESEYNSLCGIPDTNFCVPDVETNALCLEFVGGSGGSSGRGGKGGTSNGGTGATTATGGSGRGAGGSVSSPAGAGGEGGIGGSEGGMSQAGVGAVAGESASNGAQSGQGGENPASAGQATLGGAPGETGTGGSISTGGTSGTSHASAGRAGGAALNASISCQVIESPNHKGLPLSTCRPAGSGTEGSPCFSGSDCAPKFACVGHGPGQCRAYCCSGPDQCQAYTGTHCAVEPLVPEPKSTRLLPVPVCMPAVECSLAEPYPCLDRTCSCPKETACVVVTDDGTTSCVPVSDLPSEENGGEGLPCPCARGYVCSSASNKCVRLCEVGVAGTCRCQASPALPPGWGTCVGVPAKDAAAQ